MSALWFAFSILACAAGTAVALALICINAPDFEGEGDEEDANIW